MKIETARLLLRPWTLDDAQIVARVYETTSDTPIGPLAGEADAESVRARLGLLLAAAARGERMPFAAIDRATGALVGAIAFIARYGPGGQELGYWVHSACRRQG